MCSPFDALVSIGGKKSIKMIKWPLNKSERSPQSKKSVKFHLLILMYVFPSGAQPPTMAVSFF